MFESLLYHHQVIIAVISENVHPSPSDRLTEKGINLTIGQTLFCCKDYSEFKIISDVGEISSIQAVSDKSLWRSILMSAVINSR